MPPLVIFHPSQGGVRRWQHAALGAALLSCRQPLQEQRHGVGSARLPSSLAPVQEGLASPQHPGKRLPEAISSVKQNPLSILNGYSTRGRRDLTLFLFSLGFKPCLRPPLGPFSLPEVPLQLLPLLPPPLLYLPIHLQPSLPQSLVLDKPCDDVQPGSSPAVYFLRCYSVYNSKWRHFRTPSNEGVPS